MRRSCPVLVLAAVLGCGGSGRDPAVASAGPATSASGGLASPGAPRVRTRFARREVIATLSQGLGAFLAKVQVEPSLSQGRFHGWRIVALTGPAGNWDGIDLAPGDVVTDINGRAVERPEEALATWQSLAVAKELRVGRERQGTRSELVYAIDD
jgi:hypothetical protein